MISLEINAPSHTHFSEVDRFCIKHFTSCRQAGSLCVIGNSVTCCWNFLTRFSLYSCRKSQNRNKFLFKSSLPWRWNEFISDVQASEPKSLKHLLLGPDNGGSWKKDNNSSKNCTKSTYHQIRDENENTNTQKWQEWIHNNEHQNFRTFHTNQTPTTTILKCAEMAHHYLCDLFEVTK